MFILNYTQLTKTTNPHSIRWGFLISDYSNFISIVNIYYKININKKKQIMPLKVDSLITNQLTVGGTPISGSSGLQSVSVDGVTIVGDGTSTSPLTAVTPTIPYKVYTALLTQTGTTAPVATVLENTFDGEIVWSRNSDGDYSATLNGAFLIEDSFFTLNSIIYSGIGVFWNNIDSFSVTTFNGNGITIPFSPADDVLFKYPIEIRVYN